MHFGLTIKLSDKSKLVLELSTTTMYNVMVNDKQLIIELYMLHAYYFMVMVIDAYI